MFYGERMEDIVKVILNHVESIVYAINMETYELLYMNKKAKQLVNMDDNDESYYGKKCYNIFQIQDYPCTFCTQNLLYENQIYESEYYNKELNEYFNIKNIRFRYNGIMVRLEIADKASNKIEERKALSHMLETELALSQCIQTLSKNDEQQEAIEKLLKIIADFYMADRAYIFEINNVDMTASNTYDWCAEGVTRQINNLQNVPLEYMATWMEEFESHSAFYLSDLEDYAHPSTPHYQFLHNQNIKSLMAVPLRQGDDIIGFIGVDNTKKNTSDFGLLRSVTYFIINDMIKRRQLEELNNLSFKDTLTGVFNRNKYNKVINEMKDKPPNSLGMLYVDINGLKETNDTFGHQYGDIMIKEIARLLKLYFGHNVFRIGGDEFITYSTNIEREDFQKKIGELRKLVEQNEVVNASLGCCYRKGDVDIDMQISYADRNMYLEKKEYYKRNRSNKHNRNYQIWSELFTERESKHY